jgi:fatty acid-binding protein DegV
MVLIPSATSRNGLASYFNCIYKERQNLELEGESMKNIARAFRAAILEGAQTIICICVASKVSATFNSAFLASQMFQHDIVVIDSQNLSMGQGFMVLIALTAYLIILTIVLIIIGRSTKK